MLTTYTSDQASAFQTTGVSEQTYITTQATRTFAQTETTVHTIKPIEPKSTTILTTIPSETSSNRFITSGPSEASSTNVPTINEFDHKSVTFHTTGAFNQTSKTTHSTVVFDETVLTTGSSDSISINEMTTGSYDSSSSSGLMTDASDETSTISQATTISEKISDLTSMTVPTTNNIFQTSKTNNKTSVYEPNSISLALTDASESELTSATTFDYNEHSSTSVRIADASNETSTVLHTTAATNQPSITLKSTYASEPTSTSVITIGSSDFTSEQTTETSELTSGNMQTTIDYDNLYDTEQVLVSKGTTENKIADLETMLSITELESSTTKQFTSEGIIDKTSNAALNINNDKVTQTSDIPTLSESVSMSVPTTEIFNTNTVQSFNNSGKTTTKKLDDGSIAEIVSRERTAYTDILHLNTENSTAEINLSSKRITRADDSSTFSKTTEEVLITHSDTEKQNPTTVQTKEFFTSSTVNTHNTTISESNTPTVLTTEMFESGVTESITNFETSTNIVTTESSTFHTKESTFSSKSNISEKTLVTDETTASFLEAQSSTADHITTSVRTPSSRTKPTNLTISELISSTAESTTTEGPTNTQASIFKTTISEAASSILTSKSNLSTVTSSNLLTSANDLPLIISKTTTDTSSFTSDEEHISSIQHKDFSSSLALETESTFPDTFVPISVPSTIEILPAKSSISGVTTGLTDQPLTLELIDFSAHTSRNGQTIVTSDPSLTGDVSTDASKPSSTPLLSNIAFDQTSTIIQTTGTSSQASESSTTFTTNTPEKEANINMDSTVFTTAEETLTTKTADIFCSCGKCRIQDLNDCTKYLECINGEYVSKQCAVGYLYSSILEGCGMAENIECNTISEKCLKNDGFFADENDCSSYVQCYHGISYKKTCPRGLLYNPVKRTCDEKSNCGAEPVLPRSRNLDVDCDCDYCIMGDSEDCSKYYLCLNGVAYVETCSDGLLFNSETNTCDYELNALCSSQSPQCTTKTGDFPVPGNCSLYYHCVGGVAYDKKCRAGFHFSADSDRCKEACEAGCDSSLKCPFTSHVPLCLSPEDFYPNPEDCHTFYECSEGKPKLAECTDGEHFNLVENLCQDPCQAMCDPNLDCVNSTADITASMATATHPTPPWLTFEETKGFEHTTRDTAMSGEPTSGRLSTETENTSSLDQISTDLFSSVHQEANTDALITKSTSRTTRYITSSDLFPDETTETFPTTYSTFCPEPTGVYPDPEECRALFLCIDGYPMKLYCDDHLHFNPLTKRCESPCSALCDPTIACTTVEEPESPTPLPLSLCRTKDFLPKRGSCKYYYDCTSSRLRKIQKCPKGLQFNPTKRVCDLPQNSGCGELPKDLSAPDLFYKCPCEACIIPSAYNCLEYFLCLDFKAYRMKCSDGLMFDQRKNTCNIANKVICDLPTTTTFSPYSSTQKTYRTTTGHPYTKETVQTTTSYETSKQPFTTSTSKSYTTSTTKQPYTTPISTSMPYTTSTTKEHYSTSSTNRPYTTSTTREPYTTSTTREPYSTSTSTSLPYTTSTKTTTPTTSTSTREYTTSTTKRPYSTSTSRPSTTTKIPTSSTSTGISYTPSTITEHYTTSTYTSKPYTTTATNKPYITTMPTNRPYTTAATSTSTSRPYASSTTREPYTSSTSRSDITSTTVKPPTTLTSTRKPYTTSTTRKPFTISTSRPYTTKRQPYTTSTSTSKPYTTSTTRKPITISTSTSRSYATSTTKMPYSTSTSVTRPYSSSTTRKQYVTTTERPYPMSTTTKPKLTISPTKDAFRCPEANGMFRNPENCGSFIHCSNFLPYPKECPGSLHFSVETQRCEYPCDAKCDRSLSCISSSAAPQTTSNPLCPCMNCLRPNPESCTKFFECKLGKPTKKDCPKGQTFDTMRSRCDWAHRVNCKHSEICPKRNGLFPYKGDCHKFVHCANGIPYTKVCPPRLQFDPTTMRCTYATGPCGSMAPMNGTKGILNPPVPAHSQWHCPSVFGYYRHEGKCNQYYHCIEGVATLKDCPEGLFFNSKYGTCDWPNNVKCGISQSHLERRCRVFREDFRCPSNRSYASSSHCDMFFDCRTGKACIKTCPEGLFFNSDTLMCDLPDNVRCRKSDGSSYSLKRFSEICRHGFRQHAVDPATNKCYYKCYRDKLRRYCCSRNRTYNEKRGICERKTLFQFMSE